MKIPKINVKRKTGDEQFHIDGKSIGINLLSFWQWSASDLVNNAQRGVLAEFVVASALGVNKGNRVEWNAFDIKSKEGIKVEVKSASYLQSWSQKEYSKIQFNIRPTYGWDSSENSYSSEITRQSEVYVFCILKHQDQDTLDPLDLSQWEFLVLSTQILNQKLGIQKTIGIEKLKRLKPLHATYDTLKETIFISANKVY